jgi:hypothetical protein
MGWKVKRKPVSKGKCVFCEQVISKSGIRAHLESCKARKTVMQALNTSVGAKSAQFFHLAIEGADFPQYWIQLEIPADYTLQELDQFLRDIWLECCGHLSQFIIGDSFYVGHPDEEMFFDENEESFDPLTDELPPDAPPEFRQLVDSFKQFLNTIPEELRGELDDMEEKDMDVALKDVLKPGMKVEYEYDFGTTTELKLVVVSLYDSKIAKDDEDPIHVMARNEPPELVCEECGKPATLVCSECIWGGEGFVCNDHATSHALEMLLPVVNSPRMGMCGYTGEAPDDWAFWADDPSYYQDDDDEDFDDEFDDDEEDE